jgi:hypothetical protein
VNVIRTKWVFKNKQGEDGEVVRNKARLVAQGYSQVEGLDYGKTFAPVARLEAISILLAFTAFKGFKLYQLNFGETSAPILITGGCWFCLHPILGLCSNSQLLVVANFGQLGGAVGNIFLWVLVLQDRSVLFCFSL